MNQFLNAPRMFHWDATVSILQYLKHAPFIGLPYSDCGHNHVVGFSEIGMLQLPDDQTTR